MHKSRLLRIPIFSRLVLLATARSELALSLARLAIKSYYRNQVVLCELHGHKMLIPPDSISVYTWKPFEPDVTEAFVRQLHSGDVVVDVGAHIGYYTLLAAQAVGQEGRVFAFEPDPTNYDLLQKNVKLNGYKNVIALNTAVSDSSKHTALFLGPTSSENSLIRDNTKKAKSMVVETTSLDDFFKSFPEKIKIALIKIDVEGSEMLVLAGMSQIMSDNTRLAIISEYVPKFLSRSATNPQDYIKKLRENGFCVKMISSLDDNNSVILKDVDALEEGSGANLLCYKPKDG